MFTDEQCQLAYAAWFAYHTRPDAPPDHLADHEHESLTAMRLALEAAEQAAWQTIESAPRDGTGLWLFSPVHGQIEGRYDWVDGGGHPENGPPVYWWTSPHCDFCDGPDDAPTRWRPLPDPPALAKESGL